MIHAINSVYSSSEVNLVYAVNEYGRIAHISEVSRGLSCNCRCPTCKELLVARQGSQLTHSFAHQGNSNCRGGPETALHQLAKEIIKEECRLNLPAVIANHGNRSYKIRKATLVEFSEVISESQSLSIDRVPDLFAKKNERSLLIEIWVTHSCDESKRNDLKEQGIATVEIDLSNFPRNASREDIKKAVIELADRKWVYHPEIEVLITELRKAEADVAFKKKREFNRKLSRLVAAYSSGLEEVANQNTFQLSSDSEILRADLGSYIGLPILGSGCFTVSTEEWQHRILASAFAPRQDVAMPAHSVARLLDWFKELKLVRKEFGYVSPEIEKGLIEMDIGFLSPYRCIESYLDELCKRKVMVKIKNLYRAPYLVTTLNKLRDGDQQRLQNRSKLLGIVGRILQAIPETERQSLSAETWLESFRFKGKTFNKFLQHNDSNIDLIFSNLRDIEDMIFNNGYVVDETLGLPIGAECERRRAVRFAEAEEQKLIKIQLALDHENRRVDRLRHQAKICFGLDSEIWLNSPNPELEGKVPCEIVREGEHELRRVLSVLNIEYRRRCDVKNHQIQQAALQFRLESIVANILQEDEIVPFYKSRFPALSGKYPAEYCVDEKTLQECLSIAQQIKVKRRKR